jgi:hypothetical protein
MQGPSREIFCSGQGMKTYYFDKQDGVPVRDHEGIQLADHLAAVDHSQELAREIRVQNPIGDTDLYIAVLDETGREIHRERVYSP